MAHNTQVSADTDAPPITQMLAEFAATHPSQGWSADVEREAQRSVLNWLGCAIGAANHPTLAAALAAVNELAPAPQATILGRKEKVDIANAALLNGISSHTFDFDDTHLRTIIHPAGPVVSAALALAEHLDASGRALIDATVLGIDVSCRAGNMIYPDHYDRGWHITGSTGMLGAAAACARLLGLDVAKTTMAIGIAASQPVGIREQFGTMTNWIEITGELGQRFEISANTYKPFACGIVIHPSIDVALRDRVRAVVDDAIDEAGADVTVTCNDGRVLRVVIEHAIGSMENPMTDAALQRKFHGLVDPVLGGARADRLIETCGALGGASGVRALTALARP
ncbi:MAG: MmgE/PrpD family protein [Casimicrobiaceae bacterium]